MKDQRELETRARLARLWLESEPAVRAFVFAGVAGYADAEDIVQQVALTTARRFDEYDESRPFVAWVLWIAKSRIVDHYRRVGREKLIFSDALLDRLAGVLVERQSEQPARLVALERCIDKLPERSRRLLDLHYHQRLSMAGVAAAIETSAGAVRVMLFRVRNLLADCVRAELAKEAS